MALLDGVRGTTHKVHHCLGILMNLVLLGAFFNYHPENSLLVLGDIEYAASHDAGTSLPAV